MLVLLTLGQGGCYYLHLASGQWRILRAQRAIDDVLADPETSGELRARLELVLAARRFAAELGLEVGEQYTSYVPWPDDRIVTSVVATRPGEVTPAGFDFPIVGHVPYKGFFERDRAEAEARALAEQVAEKLGTAVRIGKQAFYAQAEMGLDAAYAYTGQVMVENMLDRDTEEGIAAFIEKRPPEWTQ